MKGNFVVKNKKNRIKNKKFKLKTKTPNHQLHPLIFQPNHKLY